MAPGCLRFLGQSTPVAQGPSRRTQWDSNPQPLNTCVSQGAGSTTELSATLSNLGVVQLYHCNSGLPPHILIVAIP